MCRRPAPAPLRSRRGWGPPGEAPRPPPPGRARGAPPPKDPREVTDPEPRYLMTFLATATNPHFTISRLEVEREGPSYTIDTIVEFRRRHPDEALSYITGAEAILQVLRGDGGDSG